MKQEAVSITIDGKFYRSLRVASDTLGISMPTLKAWKNEIKKSGRSTKEFRARILTTFSVHKDDK